MPINNIAIILFDRFETLDVMGPVEVFGRLDHCQIDFISPTGMPMTSSQGVTVNTHMISTPSYRHILIPGGQGSRPLSMDEDYIQWVKTQFEFADTAISVCTGSAILAKTSLLNGVKATTNKLAYEWVTSLNHLVKWQPLARWVHDGKFYTSSGISAGIDMSLQIVSDFYGVEIAKSIALRMEYIWNQDPSNDPFAKNII
ncbi:MULTISPECIES: DJ-1/PfpI family protein [Providencia]|uniref:DJ-1/PfpI family protein n=1 Tax=Providencia TaxID=586 RepID=UPI00198152B3|nr:MULTISPECIES: DJ-1/PfpI family protein [Providencia]HEC8327325.1 DJ-1/PfpI family protein [Providencia rettgeri]MBN4865046.1 DJ-1/PfpI family protein [Providencia stuartii]MBN4874729.1 DJ-1/PfpI family protein [Providencia stuartii]MBN4879058.1 DJ-1/PfpI family protein [Providencia stuartii]MBN4883929.1 DJ-1/PfpI family protein [Providencia stuartii]